MRFVRNGYFSNEDEYMETVNGMLDSAIVVVGMGAGKQEKFLRDLRSSGWKGTGFTCGGYFDQYVDANGERYYPVIVDKMNLRWLYRLL